jgi:hypothetical protein
MKNPVFGVAVSAALLALVSTPRAETAVQGPLQIDIKSTPIESFEARQPDRKRFGKLEYRGGLVLTARPRRQPLHRNQRPRLLAHRQHHGGRRQANRHREGGNRTGHRA